MLHILRTYEHNISSPTFYPISNLNQKIAKKSQPWLIDFHGFKDKLDHFDYDHTWQSILNKEKLMKKFMLVHSLLGIIHQENKQKVLFP